MNKQFYTHTTEQTTNDLRDQKDKKWRVHKIVQDEICGMWYMKWRKKSSFFSFFLLEERCFFPDTREMLGDDSFGAVSKYGVKSCVDVQHLLMSSYQFGRAA